MEAPTTAAGGRVATADLLQVQLEKVEEGEEEKEKEEKEGVEASAAVDLLK